jgi:GT2 family glycosyltransferase
MKIVIGIPTANDMIPVQVAGAIMSACFTSKHTLIPEFLSGALVYDARAQIINDAIRQGADYVLFVDSDIVFPPDAIDTLLAHNKDMVSGLYFGRISPHNPIAYKSIEPLRIFQKNAKSETISDINTPLQEVAAAGLGFCLIKMDAIRKISKRYKVPFEPMRGLGEDFSFFIRAKKCGCKLFLDTTIDLKHVGTKAFDRQDFIRGQQ